MRKRRVIPLRRRKARIKAEAYTELTASSQADALQKILRERRRELAVLKSPVVLMPQRKAVILIDPADFKNSVP